MVLGGLNTKRPPVHLGSHRHRSNPVAWVTYFCVLLSLSFPPDLNAQELSEDEQAQIIEWLKSPYYGEREAEAFADKYGSRVVPFLLTLLERQPLIVDRGHVYFCLGKIGDVRAIDPIVQFIETGPIPNPFEVEAYHTYRSAILALGFVGTDEALESVRKYMTDEYWKNRDDLPSEGSLAKVFNPGGSMQISALTAYALSLNPEAMQDLESGNRIPERLHRAIPGILKMSDGLRKRRARALGADGKIGNPANEQTTTSSHSRIVSP